MRILVVTHAFPPESTAGTESIAASTIASLQSEGCEVALFTSFTNPPQPTDFPIYWVKKTPRAALWQDWNGTARWEFQRALEHFRPDTVYFHHTLLLSFDLPLIAKKYGARVVFMLHDFWLLCPRLTLLAADGTRSYTIDRQNRCASCLALNRHPATKKYGPLRWMLNPWVARILLRRRDRQLQTIFEKVDAFISPSHTVAQAHLNRGLLPAKLTVIPYGIPSLTKVKRPKETGRPLQFGFIGSIVPHKGVRQLIEAFTPLDPARAELTIWGPRAKPAELATLTNQPHIRYAGTFAPTDTQSIYNQIDVLVAPSLWFENQPLVILQAQSAGIPVIATDLGGMRELIHHEQDGLLFAPDSIGSLHAALQRYIDEPALRRRLRKGASLRTVSSPAEHLAAVLPKLLLQ